MPSLFEFDSGDNVCKLMSKSVHCRKFLLEYVLYINTYSFVAAVGQLIIITRIRILLQMKSIFIKCIALVCAIAVAIFIFDFSFCLV